MLGDSVNALKNSTVLLKRFIEDKNLAQKDVKMRSTTSENLKNKLEIEINKLEIQRSILSNNLDSEEPRLREIVAEYECVKSEINSDSKEMKMSHKRLSILSSTLTKITEKIDSLNYKNLENEPAQKNWTRNTTLKSMDDIEYDLREHRDSLRSLESEIEICTNRINSLKKEMEDDLQRELKKEVMKLVNSSKRAALQEDEIKKLRDQEQQIIDSSVLLSQFYKNMKRKYGH